MKHLSARLCSRSQLYLCVWVAASVGEHPGAVGPSEGPHHPDVTHESFICSGRRLLRSNHGPLHKHRLDRVLQNFFIIKSVSGHVVLVIKKGNWIVVRSARSGVEADTHYIFTLSSLWSLGSHAKSVQLVPYSVFAQVYSQVETGSLNVLALEPQKTRGFITQQTAGRRVTTRKW